MPEIGNGRITQTGRIAFASGGNTTSSNALVTIQKPPRVTGRSTGAGLPVLTSIAQNEEDVLIELKSLSAGSGIDITLDNGALRIAATGTANAVLTLTGDATGSGIGTFPLVLASSGVTAGTYTVPTITVDAKGRVLQATSGTITFPTFSVTAGAGLSGGTITSAGTLALTATGVAAGTYTLTGIVVNSDGRISAASNGTLNAVTLVSAGSGLTGGNITGSGTIALSTTGVTAGTYVRSTIIVDSQGRITSASDGAAVVTSVTSGAGLIPGTITTSGTVAMAPSGVTPGTYNNASVVVDELGRVTSATTNTPADLTVYLLKSGGVMTGDITLVGDPTAALHPTTKQYVDDAIVAATGVDLTAYLLRSGGTLTGSLILSGTPTLDLEPTTKLYVDSADAGKVSKSGDVMSAPLTLSGAPTLDLHAASKLYVDTASTAAANAVISAYVPLAGGSLTGPLLLSGAPTVALNPATKAYVDTTTLPISGGSMTGAMLLSGAPTVALNPATKAYVDTVQTNLTNLSLSTASAIGLKFDVAGGILTGTLTPRVGTATFAPIQFQTGILTTTPLLGAMEFNGNDLFVTTNGPVRRRVLFADSVYQIEASVPGIPTSSQRILDFVTTKAFTLPAGLPDSRGGARVAPTGTWTAEILKNFTSTIGTVVINAAATTSTFTLASDTNFVTGDVLSVIAPSSADATITTVFLNLVAESNDPTNVLEINGFVAGAPTSSQRIVDYVTTRSFILPTAMTRSAAGSRIASTGSWTAEILKNFTSTIGLITINASTTATFTKPTNSTFSIGDVLSVVAPSSVDATITTVFLNIVGNYN